MASFSASDNLSGTGSKLGRTKKMKIVMSSIFVVALAAMVEGKTESSRETFVYTLRLRSLGTLVIFLTTFQRENLSPKVNLWEPFPEGEPFP